MKQFMYLMTAAIIFLFLDVFIVRFVPGIPDCYVFFVFLFGLFFYCFCAMDDEPAYFLEAYPCDECVRVWSTTLAILCASVGFAGIGFLGIFLFPASPLFGFTVGAGSAFLGFLVTRSLIQKT